MNAKASRRRPVPRLALTQQEAAESLGMSVDFFAEHVAPEIRVIRRGRKRLYRIADLEKWAEQNAAMTIEASG